VKIKFILFFLSIGGFIMKGLVRLFYLIIAAMLVNACQDDKEVIVLTGDETSEDGTYVVTTDNMIEIPVNVRGRPNNSFGLTDYYDSPQRIVASITQCDSGYEKFPIVLTMSNKATPVLVRIPYGDSNCQFVIESLTLTDGTVYYTEETYLDAASVNTWSGEDNKVRLSTLSGSQMILTVDKPLATNSTITTQQDLLFTYTIVEMGSSFTDSDNIDNRVIMYDVSLPDIVVTDMQLDSVSTKTPPDLDVPTFTLTLKCSEALTETTTDYWDTCHGVDIDNLPDSTDDSDSETPDDNEIVDTFDSISYFLVPKDWPLDLEFLNDDSSASDEAYDGLTRQIFYYNNTHASGGNAVTVTATSDTTNNFNSSNPYYTWTVQIVVPDHIGRQIRTLPDGSESSQYNLIIKRRDVSTKNGSNYNYENGYLIIPIEYRYGLHERYTY
jgi:hypothetical protein